MKIFIPSPDVIEQHWKEIEPLLERACEFTGGRFDVSSLVSAVATGEYQLWVGYEDTDDRPIIRIAGTTRLYSYAPTRAHPEGLKVCEVVVLGGAKLIDHIPDIEPTLLKFARKEGCGRIEIFARKGFAKVLKDWRIIGALYERDVI